MKREEIIKTLSGMLTVNAREAEAVKEAIRILKATHWRDAEYEPPEVDEDGESEYILLSFANADFRAIGRYQEDEDGGAYYDGDEEDPLTAIGLIVDGWMPLPKRRREEE
jgi:hypothetical protein